MAARSSRCCCQASISAGQPHSPDEARGAIEDLLITHADSPCGHVTVSVGVESIVPAPGQAAADLVEAADRALYAAKRRGRNTVIAHVPMVMSAA